MAAEELTAISDDVSYLSLLASRCSIIGRPMASPVMSAALTRSFSTSSHTASPLNLGSSTIVLPWNI
jgi:hypothetical protein